MELIGEGGMGMVFVAEQHQPVRRKVALKLIKPGMDSREVIARFEAERQALALMDHPNIAKILDAGVTGDSVGQAFQPDSPSPRQAGRPDLRVGRPYFVMELVKGVPITQFCDDNRLTPRERLELFVHVCQAVQHAHQKGIIHRDVKPSNVMVTSHDGRPVVKVIDFGVAKAIGQQLTERTIYTAFSQMVGTPLYMSPEQAGMSGLDVDTRTDIYSLGVLLYELLTGTTPFDKARLKHAAFDEIRRIIREEEPQKPSTRLSQLSSPLAPQEESGTQTGPPTSSLASIAACRHTEPAKLAKLMRGELDWIVMKALEKDRNRRYDAANGFVMDVQRYLADEPVLACPPSAGYRFRKFARRNKAALLTAALVTAALVAGAGISVWQAIRATRAEGLADARLQDEIRARRDSEVARTNEAEQRGLAEQRRIQAEQHFKGARSAVQQMLTRVAEERLAYIPQVEQVRRQLFEDALEFYERFLEQQGTDPTVRLEAGAAYLRQTTSILERLVSESPTNVEYGERLAQAYRTMRSFLNGTKWAEEREALSVKAVTLYERLSAQESKADHRYWLATTLYDLGAMRAGVHRAAEADYRKAVEVFGSLPLEALANPPRRANANACYNALCDLLKAAGRPQDVAQVRRQAVELYSRLAAVEPKDPLLGAESARCHADLGTALRIAGRLSEAEEAYRNAIQVTSELAAADPEDPVFREAQDRNCLLLIWLLIDHAHRPGDAEIICRERIALAEQLSAELRAASPQLRRSGELWFALGWALQHQGQFAAAAAAFQQDAEVREQLIATPEGQPSDRYELERTYTALGIALSSSFSHDEAIAAHRQALAITEQLVAEFPKESKYLGRYVVNQSNLGESLRQAERIDEADEHDRAVIDHYEKLMAESPANLGYQQALAGFLNQRAYALQKRAGALEEAIAASRRVILLKPDFADAHCVLGHALRKKGALDEAIAAYREAIRLAPKNVTGHSYLGYTLSMQGAWDEAVAEYRDAIRCKPDDLFSRSMLAAALTKQVATEEAAAVYEQLLKIKADSASGYNNLAWLLATCEEPKFRNPSRAVELARKAVALAPQNGSHWNTLGAAQYRAGDWTAAIESLRKSDELMGEPALAFNGFFLAMAHWQLGEKEPARQWYDKAVEWMDKNAPADEELRRFRAEAAELLGQ